MKIVIIALAILLLLYAALWLFTPSCPQDTAGHCSFTLGRMG
jgi:hypothetical protein